VPHRLATSIVAVIEHEHNCITTYTTTTKGCTGISVLSYQAGNETKKLTAALFESLPTTGVKCSCVSCEMGALYTNHTIYHWHEILMTITNHNTIT